MSEAIINSAAALSRFIGDIRTEWNAHKFLRVMWKVGKERSLDQNAISHVWYSQIVKELREDDELGVKRWCKLHFGVPILRAEDPDFRKFYDLAIKPHLDYEQKLLAMDHVPVTSLMTKAQLSTYLKKMQDHYREERGVILDFPDGGS
ncbi:MAG: hypothetical protein M3Q42_05230 [Pseudomonadota bacterium]|nr:hypothetical protein [Pseudomonadota bacterium]